MSIRVPKAFLLACPALAAVLFALIATVTAISRADEPTTKPSSLWFESFAETPAVLDSAKLDRIRDGMTLGAIVDELGPGRLLENTGTLTWSFKDGRQLYIQPVKYERDEVVTNKRDGIPGYGGGAGSAMAQMRVVNSLTSPPATAPATTGQS